MGVFLFLRYLIAGSANDEVADKSARQCYSTFQVVEMLARAKALEAQGRDIVHMQAGEPDFTTAPAIIEAGIAALTRGETQYSDANGLWSLRKAIADYYRSDYGVDVDPKRVMITPGASGALLLISALLLIVGRAY